MSIPALLFALLLLSAAQGFDREAAHLGTWGEAFFAAIASVLFPGLGLVIIVGCVREQLDDRAGVFIYRVHRLVVRVCVLFVCLCVCGFHEEYTELKNTSTHTYSLISELAISRL